VVWNRYLLETGDYTGVALLPLFLSCRAAVRAKTSATAAQLQEQEARRAEMQGAARDYLAMAERLLHPPAPCVVAAGGFSGSGKSSLALGLAPSVGGVPGAVVLRSDEIRKQLLGVQPLEPLGPGGYSAQITERVYATLIERASLVIRGGHSVIVDAVFAKPEHRQAVEHVAAAASVPFVGLWLDAPEHLLLERTTARRHDPSDATADVVRRQRMQDTGDVSWHRLDASQPADRVLASGEQYLADHH
jgi:predicted kinase